MSVPYQSTSLIHADDRHILFSRARRWPDSGRPLKIINAWQDDQSHPQNALNIIH